ncbi:MAG: hypothetical protein Q9184_007697, partial [Pyrenodesmia sp. 2 TL-2023]
KVADLEKRLRSLSLLESATKKKGSSKRADSPFLPDFDKNDDRWLGGYIEDDHIPFMERGVEVLHLIPNPFPRVWHTKEDDGAHLHIPTVKDWARLVTGFAAEWMELEGFLNASYPASNHDRDRNRERNQQANEKSEL